MAKILQPAVAYLQAAGGSFGKRKSMGPIAKVVAEVRELARAHTGEAVKTLVSIMNPKSAPAARVSAAMRLTASRHSTSTSPAQMVRNTSFACL